MKHGLFFLMAMSTLAFLFTVVGVLALLGRPKIERSSLQNLKPDISMARMLHGGRILISLAILMMLPAPAAAQWLVAGQRIRVTAPQLSLQRQAGRLQWLDQDSLVLAADLQRWVVPREMLTQLDSSRGRRGHLVVGLAAGVAAGFVVGAILFPPNSTGCTGSGNYAENCRLYRAGIAVGGAGLGALAGALIRTERWVALPLESVQFRPMPRRSPP